MSTQISNSSAVPFCVPQQNGIWRIIAVLGNPHLEAKAKRPDLLKAFRFLAHAE